MKPIDSHRFADRVGAWILKNGPDSDVVVSCRTRLARNVGGYPFISRLSESSAHELSEKLQDELVSRDIDGETFWVSMADADPVLRLLLRERHLASRDLAPVDPRRGILPGRAVAFGATETLSVMINEEDHLRLQGLAAGLDLDLAWERVRTLENDLGAKLEFAHSDRLGFLTGCPTNVGTGLRASVMLHLPALGLVRNELDKVFTAAHRTGLAVRGMYGEGSRAAGDFYQVSNQVTLGRTEEDLIGDLKELVPCVADFERKVRNILIEEHRASVQDKVSRSYGILRTARAMPTEAALSHLSMVRLGECLGLLPDEASCDLKRVAIQIQKGHLQALHQDDGDKSEVLAVSDRDRLRASYLRRRFSGE
ncbi:MAG: protein arginine kinase [Planctomycetota bacterium]